MKYNYEEAIKLILEGYVMVESETYIKVFFSESYAYFEPDDNVIETGRKYIYYIDGNDYNFIEKEALDKMFKNSEWFMAEM